MLALLLSPAFATDALEAVRPTFDPLEPDAPIINGVDATEDDWPMAGGLLVSGTATVAGMEPVAGRALFCSSTLIAPDVVLTAAHCVDVEGLIDAAAVQGVTVESYENLEFGWSRQQYLYEWDLMDSVVNGVKDWPSDVVMAKKWIPHAGFDILTLGLGLAENKDIALVFLEEPVLDTPFGILPTADEASQVVLDAPVTIVGWGQQQQDALPGTVGMKMMADSYISEIDDFEFQVGLVYSDARKCHGDSGGPSFLEVDTSSSEKWRVVGVTSHAYDTTDCNVTGGVDTRVDHYLEWIDEKMREGCADGTRVWCEEEGIIAPPDANGNFSWELLADDTLAGEDPGKGCGCDGTGAAGSLVPGLLGLAALRRRRGAQGRHPSHRPVSNQ